MASITLMVSQDSTARGLEASCPLRWLSDSFVAGFYRGAQWPHDDMFSFLTQFVSCAVGGFIFVWLGALMTPKLRGFSVWIFATLGIAGALALGNGYGILGFAGQSAGAVIAATLFWKDKK